MNRLEQSFADIAERHRFTRFAAIYCGERFGPDYRFEATAHFDDAELGQIPCASATGPTIERAIQNLIVAVESKRRIVLAGDDALYGDGDLLEDAA